MNASDVLQALRKSQRIMPSRTYLIGRSDTETRRVIDWYHKQYDPEHLGSPFYHPFEVKHSPFVPQDIVFLITEPPVECWRLPLSSIDKVYSLDTRLLLDT